MNRIILFLAFFSLFYALPAKAENENEKQWIELSRKRIEAAECIAIVDLENVEQSDGSSEKADHYYDMADAVILRCLKGHREGKVKIYGGSPRNFVAIQSGYTEGRFLVLLNSDSDGRLNTSGRGEALPIKNNKVHWGKQVMDLKLVKSEIKSVLEKLETDTINDYQDIVVVDVEKVVPAKKSLLGEKAVGKVVRAVRGDLKGEIEFFGGVSRDFVGGTSSGFAEGRFLVFLMEGKSALFEAEDKSVLVSADRELVKLIQDGKVSWFGVETPLDEVIKKITSQAKE